MEESVVVMCFKISSCASLKENWVCVSFSMLRDSGEQYSVSKQYAVIPQ